jgi:hypothetical protein
MEQTYAVIETQKVINVVIWDGETEWLHEGEAVLIPENSSAGIGWDYIDGEFIDNRPQPEPEQ